MWLQSILETLLLQQFGDSVPVYVYRFFFRSFVKFHSWYSYILPKVISHKKATSNGEEGLLPIVMHGVPESVDDDEKIDY